MALETATYVDALVETWPDAATDTVSQGDDHIRLLKASIKRTFPQIGAEVSASAGELNALVGVSSAIQTQLDGKASLASSNTFTGATQTISSTQPVLRFYETDADSDEKYWRIVTASGKFLVQALDDAYSVGTAPIDIDRSGTAITTLTFTNQYGTVTLSGDGATQTLALNATSASDDASVDLKRNSSTYARIATVGTAGNVVNDSDVGDLVIRTNGGAIRLTTNSGTSTNVFVSANNTLALRDGQTAPAAISGLAQIYVDTADGDLKVRFGDGTIKTIVVDT